MIIFTKERRRKMNPFYIRKKSKVRKMFKRTAKLKKGYRERDFWDALREDLLKHYSRQEVRTITDSGHIIAGFIKQPLDTPDKSSYNKV